MAKALSGLVADARISVADLWLAGGYTTGSEDVIECLRQRSRPYVFSNSLAPPLVGACIAAFDMLAGSSGQRDKLMKNAQYFREHMQQVLCLDSASFHVGSSSCDCMA